jgi:uncharacterized protein with gpF-like domain
MLISGCAVHHHHHHNPDIIIKEKSVRAELDWRHDIAIVVIHHHKSLTKKEKRLLKRKYAKHFRLGKKRVKFRFVRS